MDNCGGTCSFDPTAVSSATASPSFDSTATPPSVDSAATPHRQSFDSTVVFAGTASPAVANAALFAATSQSFDPIAATHPSVANAAIFAPTSNRQSFDSTAATPQSFNLAAESVVSPSPFFDQTVVFAATPSPPVSSILTSHSAASPKMKRRQVTRTPKPTISNQTHTPKPTISNQKHQ